VIPTDRSLADDAEKQPAEDLVDDDPGNAEPGLAAGEAIQANPPVTVTRLVSKPAHTADVSAPAASVVAAVSAVGGAALPTTDGVTISVTELPVVASSKPASTGTRDERRDNFRTVVAALIAATSVLGAVAAWQAANRASEASSYDSQALQETSREQQLLSNWTSVIDEDLRNRAQYVQHAQAAQLLKQDADALRSTDPTAASELDVQSSAESRLADAHAVQYQLIPPGSDADKTDSQLREQWLAERMRDDPELRTLHPGATISLADSLHRQANQMLFLVTLFVAALVFLTVAQFVRRRTGLVFAVAGLVVIAAALLLWPVVTVL